MRTITIEKANFGTITSQAKTIVVDSLRRVVVRNLLVRGNCMLIQSVREGSDLVASYWCAVLRLERAARSWQTAACPSLSVRGNGRPTGARPWSCSFRREDP